LEDITVAHAFVQIGARNPEIGAAFPHHHPRFTIDERCLGIGLRFYLEALQRSSSAGSALPVLPAPTGAARTAAPAGTQ
jgi:hypothetical protein